MSVSSHDVQTSREPEKITDKYVKRRRTYIDYYLEVRAQDGRLVTTYTDKTLLKYTPDEV